MTSMTRRGAGQVLAGLVTTLALATGCDDGPSEMDVLVVETGTVTEGPVSVGRGLWFELDLRVATSSGSFEAPTDLEVVPENASDLLVEIVGADTTPSGQATRVRLTPLVDGPGSVRFFADNAVEDPTFRYDAVAVDDADLTASIQGEPDSETTGTEMTAFVDSRIFFSALYRSGGQRVLGHEDLEVESSGSASSAFLDLGSSNLPAMLDLDESPHDATVRSPASGATFVVHAVDVTAIWLTELAVDGAPFTAEAPFELGVGDAMRVDLIPSDRGGARIWGMSPTPAEWELRGSSIRETGRDADGAYFEGASPGETTVLFTYGAAQAAMVVAVSN